VRLPQQDLPLVLAETITLSCGRLCEDEAPADRYAFPLCSDYELNDALIAAAESDDASAIAMLETRYASERSDRERHRIGVALLGKSGRESEIWKELEAIAEIALRFPNDGYKQSPEFAQWCDARGFDPERHWDLAYHALWVAGRDPRSRALLLRALETDNDMLVTDAIENLGRQRHFSSLPFIDKALQRMSDEASRLAQVLVYFGDPRADVVAEKYLDPEDIESYRELSEAIWSDGLLARR